MMIEFPEEVLPQISDIVVELQSIPGVRIYLETAYIAYLGLSMDIPGRKILVDGKEVLLTATEFDILASMAGHPGRIYTFAQIYTIANGLQDIEDAKIRNSVYCLIRSLRRKIEKDAEHPEYIHTVRGIGYKFEAPSGE